MTLQPETVSLPVRAPSRFAWRLAALRSRGFPLIPVLILASVGFVALFANVLAPHNPEVGSLAARFKPPFWQTGGSTKYLLGTDQLGSYVHSQLLFGQLIKVL